MKTVALVGAALAVGLTATTAWSQASTAQMLAELRGYALLIRTGQFDLAPKAMALVEQAMKQDPENPDVLNAYAIANFNTLAASSQKGIDMAVAMPALQKGSMAFEKAAAIAPDNADALAGRGASRALSGSMTGNPELMAKGVADLNRAVELGPNRPTPRLQRAFFGLNMPKGVRPDAGIEADLKQLMAWGTPREKDVLHLLLGDLYAETGKPDLARAEYQASNRTGSTKGDLAQARLAALAEGKVDPAKFGELRSQLGSNCTMCHAVN
jgi:hypothetical protein